MSNHTHQRKLRRIFGKQPVGSVVGLRQPEAGIAGPVIPSQSPLRTFRSSDDADLPTCRPADLPTCRPGDLPTWRSADLAIWRSGDLAIWSRVTTGFQPAHSSPGSTSDSPQPSVRTSRGSPQPHLRTTPSPHYLEQPSKRLLRCHRSKSSCGLQVTTPFSTENTKKLLTTKINKNLKYNEIKRISKTSRSLLQINFCC